MPRGQPTETGNSHLLCARTAGSPVTLLFSSVMHKSAGVGICLQTYPSSWAPDLEAELEYRVTVTNPCSQGQEQALPQNPAPWGDQEQKWGGG